MTEIINIIQFILIILLIISIKVDEKTQKRIIHSKKKTAWDEGYAAAISQVLESQITNNKKIIMMDNPYGANTND